jgi:type I restriction enzyme M protein
MYEIVADHLMPFLRTLGGAESVIASHMKGARLAFTKPALLDKLVQGLDKIQMDDRDTKGDVYEYLLSMISSAGENGQFRTPRHIIDLIVRLMNPGPDDTVCDPACGTAGFLMMAAEHVRRENPGLFYEEASRTHFESRAFTGYDFDETMLRIGAMNMMLHGIEEPRIAYRDSLAEGGGDDAGQYSMILANPPFAGSLDNETASKDLLKVVNTKKTELLFLALFLRMLATGGRAAVIVPDGVLFGSSKAHKGMRQLLVDEHRLEAVISLPSGVFPMPASPPRSWSSPRPGAAAPMPSGITICRPMGSAWTTSATRYCPRTCSAPRPPGCSRKRSMRRTTCPTCSSASQSAREASATIRAPRKASACRARRSPRRAMTCRSTATRKWSTRRSSMRREGHHQRTARAGGGDCQRAGGA